MARAVRVNVADGWYHTMARGTERRTIFRDDRDCRHFLELLGKMSERYGLKIHGYVLMGNHYHLLLQTPSRNCSQAMQWLNVSYSVWFNRKAGRVGHVFQGRFGSSLIQGRGDWVLVCSTYLHLNPVRVAALGLGKAENAAEALGLTEPTQEELAQRLKVLRTYEWNSYGAYAGYRSGPEWLVTEEVIRRAGGQKAYRAHVEGHVTRGVEVSGVEKLKGAVVIGTQRFVEGLKKRVKKLSREQPGRKVFASLVPVDAIIKIVEKEKKARWKDFRDRHGDWGRDMVLWLARRRSGLTLEVLSEKVGGVDEKSAGKAIQRLDARMKKSRSLRSIGKKCLSELSDVGI